jgi:eukaryotic-like serine/threonine-protein kinase
VVLSEEGVPKVTDFGLAKLMEREVGLTRTGDIMGTPSYMAPEQARGMPSEVTASADIYALGAILYEMLTGRPPFKGSTPLPTLSQAAEQDVLPSGRLQRHLPRELETICLKCLEKEPRKRYAIAHDLADDLRRFLEHRPILALRTSHAEWLWRWCRREPVKATLAAGLILAIVAGFVGVAAQKRRAEERAAAEARERTRADIAEGHALDNLYFSRLAQARLEWRINNSPFARQLLDGCDPPRRGWEWRYLENVSHPQLLDVELPGGSRSSMPSPSAPDGRQIATASVDSTIRIWDTQTGLEQSVLRGHSSWAAWVAFHPDGWCLLSGSRQGAEVKLWDLTRHT